MTIHLSKGLLGILSIIVLLNAAGNFWLAEQTRRLKNLQEGKREENR